MPLAYPGTEREELTPNRHVDIVVDIVRQDFVFVWDDSRIGKDTAI